jgi:NAD(P)-dependent dehydrogenase (short-subunit alcohol dehydrogenase family)
MSRVLIVTGGSRGLGAATCIAAAEQGYEASCVNYVANKSRADEVVAA